MPVSPQVGIIVTAINDLNGYNSVTPSAVPELTQATIGVLNSLIASGVTTIAEIGNNVFRMATPTYTSCIKHELNDRYYDY